MQLSVLGAVSKTKFLGRVAHWRANFKRLPSGNMVKLDGIFKVEFSDDGKCEVFREWWHRIEEPAFD